MPTGGCWSPRPGLGLLGAGAVGSPHSAPCWERREPVAAGHGFRGEELGRRLWEKFLGIRCNRVSRMWTNRKKTQRCWVQFLFPTSGHLIANPSPPTSNLPSKEHTNDHISVMGQNFKSSSYFKRVLPGLWGTSMPPPLSTRELWCGIAECKCPVTGNTSSGAESNGTRKTWVRKVSDGHSILSGQTIVPCAAAVVLFLCVSSPLHFPLKLDCLNVKLPVKARQSHRVSRSFHMKGFYPALLETWPMFCPKFRECQQGWIWNLIRSQVTSRAVEASL